MVNGLIVQPPRRVPILLRPLLWLARRMTGKDTMPARRLAHFPKGAVAAGLLELVGATGAEKGSGFRSVWA